MSQRKIVLGSRRVPLITVSTGQGDSQNQEAASKEKQPEVPRFGRLSPGRAGHRQAEIVADAILTRDGTDDSQTWPARNGVAYFHPSFQLQRLKIRRVQSVRLGNPQTVALRVRIEQADSFPEYKSPPGDRKCLVRAPRSQTIVHKQSWDLYIAAQTQAPEAAR
jgi:hypothetical protein